MTDDIQHDFILTKNGLPKPVLANAITALKHEPAWQGRLAYDELGLRINQVTKALGKTIRAMADGSLDSQLGARICNGLGIMRTTLETATLERIEDRLNRFEGVRTNGNTTIHRAAIGTHR
jgi:YD repeat-containing protein